MSLPIAILLVIVGFVLLAGGGEVLVRGAVSISRQLRVSTAVIGLTVVALATSLPELAVSLLAAAKGSPDVAVGNVVGSNIFNVAAILGLSALLFPPLRFRSSMIKLDVIVMTAAALLAVVLTRDHNFSRGEGIVFLVLLVVFLTYRTRNARREDVPEGEGAPEEIEGELEVHTAPGGVLVSLVLILVGAGLLTGGAEVLVRGAVRIAEIAGVSERVIAITLISAGTGLPELATAIMAGVRKHVAVSIGNVIGSNIFNVFGILGTVAVVKPVPVSPQIAGWDMWWFLAFCSAVLLPAFVPRRSISRVEGTILLALYVLYIVTLLR